MGENSIPAAADEIRAESTLRKAIISPQPLPAMSLSIQL